MPNTHRTSTAPAKTEGPANRPSHQGPRRQSQSRSRSNSRGHRPSSSTNLPRQNQPAASLKPTPPTNTLKVIPLGGIGEMGKNLTVFEYGEDMIVVDCGSTFPDETMLGIDLVIPDITYLEQNRKRLRAVLITHGHEDHIGGIPYLMPKLGVPVYAPRLAAALIKTNLEEFANARSVKVNTFGPEDVLKFGVFTVSFFRVNHSIPDSFGFFIDTPEGRIVVTGDFKFDLTPPDGIQADYEKLIEAGKNKPLLLMSESTYVHSPGHSPSEQTVADVFMDIFAKTRGRLIVASFASRIDRMQHVMAAAIKYHRKVVVTGRSMLKYLEAATTLGYIKYPQDLVIQVQDMKKYRDSEIVILSTGSQGQQGSALQRMAFNEHRQIKIKPTDTAVISSSPIPGNERAVTAIINNLYRLGATVLFDKNMNIHASGHGYRGEMEQMLEMVKPEYFIPMHGDYHMLVAHKAVAEGMGVEPSKAFVIEDGKIAEFKDGKGQIATRKVHVGNVLVDGLGVGDVKEIVLRDRQTMAAEGVFTIIAVVDKKGRLIGSPDIISRGFVYMRDQSDLMNKTRQEVQRLFKNHIDKVPDDWSHIKNKIRENVSEYLFRETQRRPLVLPVIIET